MCLNLLPDMSEYFVVCRSPGSLVMYPILRTVRDAIVTCIVSYRLKFYNENNKNKCHAELVKNLKTMSDRPRENTSKRQNN